MKDYTTRQEMHDCHTNCLQIDDPSPIFFLIGAAFAAGVFAGAVAVSIL